MAVSSDLLTDVEACALAIVRREQPCTSYAIRKSFEISPVAQFSSSAGSIYPLMKRLEKRRYIEGKPDATGERPRTLWTCTKAGETALRAWISTPLETHESLPFDPLRTRMLFLRILPPKQRLQWIERSREQVAAAIDMMNSYHDESPLAKDEFFELAHQNCMGTLRMQQRWLSKARETMLND